jgi:subtilisin-like proprotein convertase family protein
MVSKFEYSLNADVRTNLISPTESSYEAPSNSQSSQPRPTKKPNYKQQAQLQTLAKSSRQGQWKQLTSKAFQFAEQDDYDSL